MSWLGRLFGGSGGGDVEPPAAIEYNGFRIIPTPIPEGRVFRLSARIEKGEGDAVKVHELIRADTLESIEQANEASVNKAKQMIDQMGDRVFG